MINIGMNISFLFKLILFLKGELYVFTYTWTLKTKQTIITKQKQTQIQAPLSMGFCRQEYWSRLPCPPPGDLLDPGIKPESLLSSALAVGFFTTSATWEAPEWRGGQESKNVSQNP